MTDDLDPVPSGTTRNRMATRVRHEATLLAHDRVQPPLIQQNNGEAAAALASDDNAVVFAAGTFTKGLNHDEFGRVRVGDLRTFVSEINQDAPGSALGETPFPGTYSSKCPAPFDAPKYGGGNWNWPFNVPVDARNWESPLAGHTLETNGPDPDDVAIPPAPELGSAELIAEIAEVYAMTLIRDIPFTEWNTDSKVSDVVSRLGQLAFYQSDAGLDDHAKDRRSARVLGGGTLSADTLFRGSTPGAQTGPYISQFMLMGNAERMSADEQPAAGQATASVQGGLGDALNRAAKFVPPQLRPASAAGATAAATDDDGSSTRALGFIKYGPQAISQQIIPHRPGRDHMTDWGAWHDVQNGANRKNLDYYLMKGSEEQSHFLMTPRDIATYVHFDALYQAYLNACLILLDEKEAVTDVGLPEGPFIKPSQGHDTRDGFALFGGPHILTLVCECATRALKAVRRQKYNVHLRARPEFLAAAIAAHWNGAQQSGQSVLGQAHTAVGAMVDALNGIGLLKMISDHNKDQNAIWGSNGWPVDLRWIAENKNGLLPMAFPEGSPMHPSYGAGHATVAGACVTMLKAFFEMFNVTDGSRFKDGAVKRGKLDLAAILADPTTCPAELFSPERTLEDIKIPKIYVADPAKHGEELKQMPGIGLTIQGELDKLAANISIARNFAGVHYYTDYYESLRMGERITVGILQEQMLTYREPLSMRFTSFDRDRVMLIGTGGSRDLDDTPVLVWDKNGTAVDYRDWWTR